MADPDLFEQMEFEPLALLRLPLASFTDAGAVFRTGQDDLDDYEYAVFKTDEDAIPFTIFHYRQASPTAVDLFVRRGDAAAVSPERLVRLIAKDLVIEPGYFVFNGMSDLGPIQPSSRTPRPTIHGVNAPVA